VLKETAWNFIKQGEPGKTIFEGEEKDRYEGVSRYAYLGALGPDVPGYYDVDVTGYFFGEPGVSPYFDVTHYNKQGEFVLQLMNRAKNLKNIAQKLRVAAYAMGHMSHVAADVIIHPYVNTFAGIYHSQYVKDIHRTVEVNQDSWLAQKYFGEKHIDDNDVHSSWTNFVPKCFDIFVGTWVSKEAQDVLTEVSEAYRATYGFSLTPNLEYLKDSYENLYSNVLNTAYDTAVAVVPKDPNYFLVEHRKIIRPYKETFVLKSAKQASVDWCNALLNYYKSPSGEQDKNTLRETIENWNLDTGQRISIELRKGTPPKLVIKVQHSWNKYL